MILSLAKRALLTTSVFTWWTVGSVVSDIEDYRDVFPLGNLQLYVANALEEGWAEAGVAWKNDYFACIPYRELPWWLEMLKQDPKSGVMTYHEL